VHLAMEQRKLAMNRWNIPPWLEDSAGHNLRLLRRRFLFSGDSRRPAVVGARRQRREDYHSRNIARCCMSCNASKGTQDLAPWLLSKHCERKGKSRVELSTVPFQAPLSG